MADDAWAMGGCAHGKMPIMCLECQRREADRLANAIRRHRDYRGDDRCWMDDEELYGVLPEGFSPLPREVAVELANCESYLQCRRNPKTEYVSPQREIDRLREENEGLLLLIAELTDPDLCRYDHHGLCHAHSLHANPCPHQRAKKLALQRSDKPCSV